MGIVGNCVGVCLLFYNREFVVNGMVVFVWFVCGVRFVVLVVFICLWFEVVGSGDVWICG